jgi:predicted dehydrogenase
MKRHDPAVRRLLELLPSDASGIRCISIEVTDPGFVPFVSHLPMVRSDDLSEELKADGRRRVDQQIGEATGGGSLPPESTRAFQGAFLSSLVHDINLLHAILEHVGHPVPAQLADAAIFAGGDGGAAGWQLEGGGRASAFHLTLEGVNDYTERVTVYCTDRILELTFPSPYLRNMPSRLVERRSDGPVGLTTTVHHVSYEEAFENELRSFHRSITEGTPIETTLERARADVQGLLEAHHHATRRLREMTQ